MARDIRKSEMSVRNLAELDKSPESEPADPTREERILAIIGRIEAEMHPELRYVPITTAGMPDPLVDLIVVAICNAARVGVKPGLYGRSASISMVNRTLCWLLREHYHFSFPEMARIRGRESHSNSIKLFRATLPEDIELAKQLIPSLPAPADRRRLPSIPAPSVALSPQQKAVATAVLACVSDACSTRLEIGKRISGDEGRSARRIATDILLRHFHWTQQQIGSQVFRISQPMTGRDCKEITPAERRLAEQLAKTLTGEAVAA